MSTSLSLCFLLLAAMPVESNYFDRVIGALEAGEKSLPAMQDLVEQSADLLEDGGAFWAAGHPALVSEVCGRAGGFMMIRSLGTNTPTAGDLLLFFEDKNTPCPTTMQQAAGLCIRFGDYGAESPPLSINSRAASFALDPILANAVVAWIFTGELVAALSRREKTPVLYESIGMYDGFRRIQEYQSGKIAFHEDLSLSPVPFGVLARSYCATMVNKLRRVQREEQENLLTVADWLKTAKAKGKPCFMYSMGHLFPALITSSEIGDAFQHATWNAGFRRHKKPEDEYTAGAVVIHVGYQHPPKELLDRARPKGAQVAYISVRPDRDSKHDPGAVHIDPMWDWPDACVTLPGYDIPILPASGIINGALAWEIFRLSDPSNAKVE